MISVFISYAHADEELRRQLDVHLVSLKRQGIVDVWHDRRITAGEHFAQAIDEALIRADVVLLLVSPDFIASEYCYEIEMRTALERQARGETVVIPVILRASDWQTLPFGHLRATPSDGKPIRLFADLDSAFVTVVRDIKAAALQLHDRQKPVQRPAAAAATSEAVVRDAQRSGNLRVRATFTDFDRDRFTAETFDYIARYFKNSLDELSLRNAGIRSQFRPIDPTAFEAALYDERGAQRSRAGIWTGGGRGTVGDIGYSAAGVGDRNSWNESLSVTDDGISLGLRPLGMLNFGAANERKLLTQEGAAEYLWSAFIEPLQR